MAAFLLLAFACAPPSPKGGGGQDSPATSPSPSPTPTVPVAMSASAPFHGGEVGVGYAAVFLSASGGVAPYRWAVSSGALPGGLTLGTDGSVSGTPNVAGTFSFTIQVGDSGDSSASLPGTIAIAAALAASLIPTCSSYCSVELGCVSVCGSFGQLTGGVAPYTYGLAGGVLPSGTSLSGLALVGTFTGTSGWVQFTVHVADAMGATTTVAPKFWMYDHISLAGGTCLGNYGTGCSIGLPISGGVPGSPASVKLVRVAPNPNQGCWQKNATSPPPGYGLAVSSGNVVVTIPSRIINGYGAVWTLTVNDQSLCAASTYCTSPQATVTIGVQCG
jgi:Putative Ig domain